MTLNLQPFLGGHLVLLRPLQESDFDALYAAASDPAIWEQHPENNRFEKQVFCAFFDAAIQSKGALLALDRGTKEVIGTSRFYDLEEKGVAIGYTFLIRSRWGGLYNLDIKKQMLNHAFQSVDRVYFHIGEKNNRSRKAIEKMGAHLIKRVEKAMPGGRISPTVIYEIQKQIWKKGLD